MAAAGTNGAVVVGGGGGDLKATFRQIYDRLKSELLQDDAFDYTDEARQWIDRMLDYNVPGGKLNRGLSVIDSYKLLKEGNQLNDEEVGLIAVNDGILLRNHIPRILKRHFKGKPYYVDLLDLFNEVACALLMAGENLDNFVDVKNILVEMGTYFQVQDDFLDCFGDPEVIGKIGTDIEDFKCSWLVVQALQRADENQMKTLSEIYGKSDPTCVAKVKSIYRDLDLQNVFTEYEWTSYEQLISSIEAQPSKAVQGVLKNASNEHINDSTYRATPLIRIDHNIFYAFFSDKKQDEQ
ncbi:Farnesyl [Musa troglodytarum]|uniref:Farnesyl n=1 Tax=Musa troglodytarum TaxID=320322 RepID=A0A9E7H2W8_9LILI|nr:Farnesyl [Musa troglodytarum]